MKTYNLLIKSHTDYPDFEDSTTARSKRQAVAYFKHANPWLKGYTNEMIFNNIDDGEEPNLYEDALKKLAQYKETI